MQSVSKYRTDDNIDTICRLIVLGCQDSANILLAMSGLDLSASDVEQFRLLKSRINKLERRMEKFLTMEEKSIIDALDIQASVAEISVTAASLWAKASASK